MTAGTSTTVGTWPKELNAAWTLAGRPSRMEDMVKFLVTESRLDVVNLPPRYLPQDILVLIIISWGGWKLSGAGNAALVHLRMYCSQPAFPCNANVVAACSPGFSSDTTLNSHPTGRAVTPPSLYDMLGISPVVNCSVGWALGVPRGSCRDSERAVKLSCYNEGMNGISENLDHP